MLDSLKNLVYIIGYLGDEDDIRAAADAGVQEWLLWNASNNYDNVKSGL